MGFIPKPNKNSKVFIWEIFLIVVEILRAEFDGSVLFTIGDRDRLFIGEPGAFSGDLQVAWGIVAIAYSIHPGGGVLFILELEQFVTAFFHRDPTSNEGEFSTIPIIISFSRHLKPGNNLEPFSARDDTGLGFRTNYITTSKMNGLLFQVRCNLHAIFHSAL